MNAIDWTVNRCANKSQGGRQDQPRHGYNGGLTMHVFENRLFLSSEKSNICRLTECSTLNPHNYWLSNGRSIKDKNLKSEIETQVGGSLMARRNRRSKTRISRVRLKPRVFQPVRGRRSSIKDKNLKSEIETNTEVRRTGYIFMSIKDKNLKSEIETLLVVITRRWLGLRSKTRISRVRLKR